jgi:hypothetical protein
MGLLGKSCALAGPKALSKLTARATIAVTLEVPLAVPLRIKFVSSICLFITLEVGFSKSISLEAAFC